AGPARGLSALVFQKLQHILKTDIFKTIVTRIPGHDPSGEHQSALGEECAGQSPMADHKFLVIPEKTDFMLAKHRTTAQGGNTDFLRLPFAGAAINGLLVDSPGDAFRQK